VPVLISEIILKQHSYLTEYQVPGTTNKLFSLINNITAQCQRDRRMLCHTQTKT